MRKMPFRWYIANCKPKNFTAKAQLRGVVILVDIEIYELDDDYVGEIFLALELNNQVKFFDSRKWFSYHPEQLPPAFYSGKFKTRHFELTDSDLSRLTGARLYVGYGSNFLDMLKRANYSMILLIPAIKPESSMLNSFRVMASYGAVYFIEPFKRRLSMFSAVWPLRRYPLR